jgi:hypothetical protein
MTIANARRRRVAWLVGWLGKVLAAGLCLFWGTFFVEHLTEWFAHPIGAPPPPFVWAAMVFHFVIVLGLGLIVWKERPGALATIAGTLAFFLTIGGKGAWWLVPVTLLPVACVALARWLGRTTRPLSFPASG